MPPSKVGLSELRKMYYLIPDKADIQKILELNPQNLLLIRLGMGYSLHMFSSLLGTSYVNISEIERGKRKSISPPLLEKISSKTNKLPRFEQIEENYSKITALSLGGQRQAMKMAEKASFTKSERLLADKLMELNVNFASHQTITTSMGPVNVDFVIKTKFGDIVIEITESVRRQKLESMSYRALKIKQSLKNILLVSILPDHLTESLKKRLEDFDVVLRFSDIGGLERKLQIIP